jgi:hypothetical protein
MRRLAALLCFLATVVTAQEPSVPAELLALRARTAAALAAASVPLAQQSADDFRRLEETRAARGDYDGASRAAALRAAMEREAATAAETRPSLLLHARDVKTRGSGIRDDPKSGVIFFIRQGATVEWEVRGAQAGLYEARITCAVAPGKVSDAPEKSPSTGGVLAFSRIGGLGPTAEPLRFTVSSTGGWNLYERFVIGRLAPGSGPVRFRLVAEKAGSDGIMNLARIDLVPIPDLPGDDSSSDLPSQLADAKARYRKAFAEQAAGATDRYRRDLAAIESAYERLRDADGVARVRQERLRLAHAPDPSLLTAAVSAPAQQPLILAVGDALGCRWRGDMRLSNARDLLTNLRPAGSAEIFWKLRSYNVPAGRWKVKLHTKTGPLSGGSAELTVLAAANAPLGNPLALAIKPSQSPEERLKSAQSNADPPAVRTQEIDAGTLELTRQAETIALRITGLTHEDGSLCDLVSLELSPAPP